MPCTQQWAVWQQAHQDFMDSKAATAAARETQAQADAELAAAQAALDAAESAKTVADQAVEMREDEQNAANQRADAAYSAALDCEQIDRADLTGRTVAPIPQ